MEHPPLVRKLPAHPDLAQLERQAKALLKAFLASEQDAVAQVDGLYHDADLSAFALHDAQLVVARSYGYDSWPKLKAFVDGVTVSRLIEAARSADIAGVRAILAIRPELVNGWSEGYTALHHAVMLRLPDMVRALMASGANARAWIHPYRDATSALTLAIERGYDDIVKIIQDAERRRAAGRPTLDDVPEQLQHALRTGDEEQAIAVLGRRPALVQFQYPQDRRTLLHVASSALFLRLATWLLDHGADASARTRDGVTPLEMVGSVRDEAARRAGVPAMTALLRERGAALTPRTAVMLGDEDSLRAFHERGVLAPPRDDRGWLLRLAIDHDRQDMLALLLDLGLDPDARVRVDDVDEVAYTWGMPLYECARHGKHAMAEVLLEYGADPNGQVYASGTPLSEAYGQRDDAMVALLERYGGTSNPSMAGLYRRRDLAARLLAEHGDASLPDDGFGSGTVAEQLVASAARGGDAEILRMGLERIDVPHGDPRWTGLLRAPLGFWNHGIGPWCHHDWDRGTYLTCFRMILERSGPPNNRLRCGTTILHEIVTMGDHVTAEERVAFATAALDAGARLDVRDDILESTPLGWACRWGREELVRLFLARGADPAEPDAEPWATPLAWAGKKGHHGLVTLLRQHARS